MKSLCVHKGSECVNVSNVGNVYCENIKKNSERLNPSNVGIVVDDEKPSVNKHTLWMLVM